MAGVIDPLGVAEPASPRRSPIRARAGLVAGRFRPGADLERDRIQLPGFEDRACLALGGSRVSMREERRRETASDRVPPPGRVAALTEFLVLEVGRFAKHRDGRARASREQVRAPDEHEFREPHGRGEESPPADCPALSLKEPIPSASARTAATFPSRANASPRA